MAALPPLPPPQDSAAWLRQFAADLDSLAALPSFPTEWCEQLHTLARQVRAAAQTEV